MIVYVNKKTGRELYRPRPSRYLDASPGWERIEWEPVEGDADPDEGLDKEDNQHGWS